MTKTAAGKSSGGDVEQTDTTEQTKTSESATTQSGGDVDQSSSVNVNTGDTTNVEIDWSPWTKHYEWDRD